MKIVYKCKLHKHPYTVCARCAHQYCAIYWAAGCPRCAERRAAERMRVAQAERTIQAS